MNIVVIFTGGTIGSSLKDDSLSLDSSSHYKLIDDYQKQHDEIKFKALNPLNILSENIQPSHWTTMIEAVEDVCLNDFDGIILTHGTDTLSFTANALALYFTTISLPLVLVSSHLPLTNPQNNGHSNFSAAIEFIKQKISGIYVAYQNPSETSTSIFHAHHITQSPQLSSRFDTIKELAAIIDDNECTILSANPIPQTSTKNMHPLFSEEILYIKPYPGLNYQSFNLQEHHIIMHDLYHSGTCDITKLKPFIRQCKRENILLFMAPLYQVEHYYETTQELIDMGVHFLYDISIEHALTKLMFGYRNFSSDEKLLDYMCG